jgi:hypothetical protein
MKACLALIILTAFLSCNKFDEPTDLDKVTLLANKYDFVVSNKKENSIEIYTISELEQIMQSINTQKKVSILLSTEPNISIDTNVISEKINELKFKASFNNKIIIKDTITKSFEDPIYKYSKTLYFRNGGLLPNYAINIQYNASNGNFTGVSISASPYGSYYFAGQFSTFGQPQIFYTNGSLAFQLRTSMLYSLNFPGVPYLGLSSTIFSQFNGYLQLDDNNNMSGSGFQSPFDPDAFKYK